MNLYYRISEPSDVRDLGDLMAAWVSAGNPKASDWALQPIKPSEDSQWVDGEWITLPEPKFTAEQVVSNYFSPYQIAALSRLEMALGQANKPLDQQMTGAKTWLESVMLSWAMNPTAAPAITFGVPSVTFEEASAEAVAGLLETTQFEQA